MSPTPNQTDVYGSDVQTSDESYPPCVNCGATPYDAPEGLKPDGSPQWDYPHCYKCGHREGTDVSDVRRQEREFEEFKAWQQQRYAEGSQRGLLPPDESGASAEEVQRMRDQIEAMQAELADRTVPPTQLPPPFPFGGQGGNG